ncbi:unnamed protein product [Pedinophyceae sp. YPF-701]|nr:unnamed protein product [Pedinophyceae sp. YPF-701]
MHFVRTTSSGCGAPGVSASLHRSLLAHFPLAGGRAAAALRARQPQDQSTSSWAARRSSIMTGRPQASRGDSPPAARGNSGSSADGSPRRSGAPARTKKDHKCAVCLVPPSSLWDPIQRVRVRHDKGYGRWMPHINLIYPCVEASDESLDRVASALASASASSAPFAVPVGSDSLGLFRHSARSSTVWVGPQEGAALEQLRELQRALASALTQAFPDVAGGGFWDLSNDPSRDISAFAPHLSLGQFGGGDGPQKGLELCASVLPPRLSFLAQELVVITRAGFDAPFEVRRRVRIGSGAASAPASQPYVCRAVPQDAVAAHFAAARHGTRTAAMDGGEVPGNAGADVAGGAWDGEGVWYFAYGANMAPSKAEGARGLRTEMSSPAVLRDWRLLFAHRGGFATPLPRAAVDEVCAASGRGLIDGTPQDVHGVLHRLTPSDMQRLAGMEHEYWPVEVQVEPYQNSPAAAAAGARVRAVAFVTPPERCVAPDAPPTARYLGLLREGAAHWGLDAAYARWLEGAVPSVDGKERGAAHYASAFTGEDMAAWPKIRTGADGRRKKGRGGRGGGGRGRGRTPQ